MGISIRKMGVEVRGVRGRGRGWGEWLILWRLIGMDGRRAALLKRGRMLGVRRIQKVESQPAGWIRKLMLNPACLKRLRD